MRAAVIGLGVIGKVHAAVLKEQGEELVAVCDIRPDALEGYDCAHYSDYIRMLDAERIGVVHVCTPHYLHADMTVEALKRGVNVLCEKPLCIKREDIPRILAAEKQSSAMLGVCFQNRYNPSSVFAKGYLEGRRAERAEGRLYWHRDAAYYASGEWRGKWATEGGGVLMNQAIHTVDLLIWLMGEPVTARGKISAEELGDVIEVEDTACALFSGGKAPFTIYATNTAKKDMPVVIRVAAEGGELVITPSGAAVGGKPVKLDKTPGARGKSVYGSGHERLIADFYDCVRSGRKFPVDGEEGAKSVRAVLAVYASDGKDVPLRS